MHFVLDDGSWAPADIDKSELEDGLDALADLLMVARARGEVVALYDEIWDAQVVGTQTMDALLFQAQGPQALRRDTRVRLERQLEQLRRSSFDIASLPELDATVGETSCLSPSAVRAWSAAKERQACACLTPPSSTRSGPIRVLVAGEEQSIHYVSDEKRHVEFFREAIRLENADEDAFAELAPFAFPELEFVDGVWRGLRDLSRPYRDRRDELIHHFTVLSDEGPRIFALGQHARIEAEFGSLKVRISPENTETLADGKCRRARERTHRGKTLVFEWHTKIEAHTDRIHVHPGGDGGRVIVGIIAQHLPLPGD